MNSPAPWSTLQSNFCLTRNSPCDPAKPSYTGSTLGAGTGLAGVIISGSGGGSTGGGGGTDYWAFNAATQQCELNPVVVGGTPTYGTQIACEIANGITPPPPPAPVDYWAFDPTTQSCQLNPVVVGGTPTYATLAECQADNP